MAFFDDSLLDNGTDKVALDQEQSAQTLLIARYLLPYLSLQSIFLLLTSLYVCQVAYYCWLHQLSSVPGPFLARFSESWRNFHYFRGTWPTDIAALHEKYGKVVRIAPNEISFVDRDALRALYGHGKPSQKSNWYDVWIQPDLPASVFATTDIKSHRFIRGRISTAYSMTSMLSMEPFIQKVADTNWRKFRELANRGQPIEINDWTNFFALDVVATLALGEPLNMLEQEKDVGGIIRSLHDGFFLISNVGNMPLQMFWFNNKVFKWMAKNFGGEKLNAMNVFLEWVVKNVQERMTNGLGDKRRDMLQHFVEMKDQNGEAVDKRDIMIECANVLGAGADTTSFAILVALGDSLQHPEWMRKLVQEIDQAYKALNLEGTGMEIGYKDCEQLPILCAMIKESMRLRPSISYQLPRIPPDVGVQIGPYHFDKTVVCSISAASTNRDKDAFSPEPNIWNPDRWISRDSDDEQRISEMNKMLTTFGMGSRNCIGRNLALVEVHKYIAQFFRHFEADIVNKDRPWVTKSQWFSSQTDFWVSLKERQH